MVKSGHEPARPRLGVSRQIREFLHEPVHEIGPGDTSAGSAGGPAWLWPVPHLPHDQLHRPPEVPGLFHPAESTPDASAACSSISLTSFIAIGL